MRGFYFIITIILPDHALVVVVCSRSTLETERPTYSILCNCLPCLLFLSCSNSGSILVNMKNYVERMTVGAFEMPMEG